MRLDGRRNSRNVIDRRGSSGGMMRRLGFRGGIVGVIVVAAATLLGGGSLTDVFSNIMSQGGLDGLTEMISPDYVPDAEDERLADLSSKVLAGTEDVWTEVFREQGWGEYEPPKMVLYTGSVQSGCGQASSQIGPFYCSADETVYIDLSFFKDMQRTIGAGGDFTYAYVIAHEVGHHVQHLLGTLDKAHAAMSRLPETQANKISVRLELQADYYAGVWANRDNRMFSSIEPGDIEKAVNAASKIGDDYLQQKANGVVVPESFNHGRSSQRVKWLTKGVESGNPLDGDTFSPLYTNL